MAVTIYPSLVQGYAKAIYVDGTRNYSSILPDYVEPVKRYSATGIVNGTYQPPTFRGYTLVQIDNALAKEFITQEEYSDTLAYVQQGA